MLFLCALAEHVRRFLARVIELVVRAVAHEQIRVGDVAEQPGAHGGDCGLGIAQHALVRLALKADIRIVLLAVGVVLTENVVADALLAHPQQMVVIAREVLALQAKADFKLPGVALLERMDGMNVVRQLVKRHPNPADEAVCEREGRVVSEAEHIKPGVQRGFDIGFIRADGVLAAGCVRVKIMLHNCSLQKDAPTHVDGASFA